MTPPLSSSRSVNTCVSNMSTAVNAKQGAHTTDTSTPGGRASHLHDLHTKRNPKVRWNGPHRQGGQDRPSGDSTYMKSLKKSNK